MTTFDLAAVEERLAKITHGEWNGDFIAHAPSDLAAAIAVIKAKEVLIEELKAALSDVLPHVRRNGVLRELAYQRARGVLAKVQK